jgi:hypothetical protein
MKPSQPLTSAVRGDADGTEVARTQEGQSDVISFHDYRTLDIVKQTVASMKKYGRPVLCTEYMARPQKSLFETHLPYFKEENISAFNWGFVSGKTNTIYAWGQVLKEEPKVWFHDILRSNGKPFSQAEVDVIKKLTGKSK